MLASVQGPLVWLFQNVLPFVLLITPVVFFHELGHFLVARACGVTVETFSIGFGPAIVGWTDRKGTRWKISWIPLGGYVKFLGDANVASMPDSEQLESMSEDDRKDAFPFKPLYQRALVVVAGPLANFILAISIFAGLFLIFGTPVIKPVVSRVTSNGPAAHAGLHAGDMIISVDGVAVQSFNEIPGIIFDKVGQTIPVVVDRNGKVIRLGIAPYSDTDKETGERVGRFGIGWPDRKYWSVRRYGPFEALAAGAGSTWTVVDKTFDLVIKRFTFQLGQGQIRGPLGIAQVSARVASVSWVDFIQLAALISVSVGLINLFPIPVLDGGHLLYYGFEAVLGKPLGARAQDVGFRLGLALMLGFFLFATWNDLARLLHP
jgi:regulator of sigma E protease